MLVKFDLLMGRRHVCLLVLRGMFLSTPRTLVRAAWQAVVDFWPCAATMHTAFF